MHPSGRRHLCEGDGLIRIGWQDAREQQRNEVRPKHRW